MRDALLLLFLITRTLAQPAQIIINSPSPLVTINDRLTFQAVAGGTIQFNITFLNKVPVPEASVCIRYLRLLHAEEEAHPIGKVECFNDNEPCMLSYNLTANEFADSIHTARGVDETGATVVEKEFYITVDEAVNLRWNCFLSCDQQIGDHLIITPETTGYPMPYLYQIKGSDGEVIEEITADTDRVVFNLSEAQVGVGTELTLVATNYLGDSTSSKSIQSPFTTTTTAAAITLSADTSKQTASKDLQPLIIGLSVAGVIVLLIVLVGVVLRKHIRKIGECVMGAQRNRTRPNLHRERGSGDSLSEERRSLAEETSDSQPSDNQIVVQPSHSQVRHNIININVNTGGVSLPATIDAQSVESVRPDHQPRMDSAGQESSASLESGTVNSLEGDGTVAVPTEPHMDDLKDNMSNSSDSDLEADGGCFKPQNCTEDSRLGERLTSPVQVSPGQNSYLSDDSLV